MFTFDDNDNFNTERYRQLLDRDETRGLEHIDQPEEPESIDLPKASEAEDFFEAEELSDSEAAKLLRSGKAKNFSKTVDNALQIRKDTEIDVANTFQKLFTELNTTYGLDIQFSFDSFTKTLGYIINPKNQKAIELYLSESYSRVRATLYIMYLKAIATLSQQILDPKFIQSNSMSYADKLVLMRELFEYIKSLDAIYEKVKIDDSDIRLRELAKESEDTDDMNNPEVQQFMDALLGSIKKKDK